MNLTELCKFIQESGFEIALLADPQTGGVKFIARKWYGAKHNELLMDVHHVTPELIDKVDDIVQMFINRMTHHLEQLNKQNSEQ